MINFSLPTKLPTSVVSVAGSVFSGGGASEACAVDEWAGAAVEVGEGEGVALS